MKKPPRMATNLLLLTLPAVLAIAMGGGAKPGTSVHADAGVAARKLAATPSGNAPAGRRTHAAHESNRHASSGEAH